MIKQYVLIFFLIIIFIAVCGILFFSPSLEGVKRIWKGFYLIGIPEKDAEKILKNGLLDNFEIISANNTIIKYNDYSEIKNINLTEINERFIEGDPRLDLYMKGANEYFFTKNKAEEKYSIIYIRSKDKKLPFYMKLKKTVGNNVNKWLLPDFGLWNNVFSAIFYIISCTFLIKTLGYTKKINIILSLPCFILVLLNGLCILPASIVIYFFTILALNELNKDIEYYLNYGKFSISDKTKLFLFNIVALFLSIICFNLYLRRNIFGILVSLIAIITVFLLNYFILSVKSYHQEHNTFFPVYFNLKNKNNGIKITREIIVIVILLIICPALSLFLRSIDTIKFPKPKEVEWISNWSWDQLKDLHKERHEGLIDIYDYVSHIAFQEAYMFGRGSKFPYKNEKILQEYYKKDGEKINYEIKCILQFTEEWYSNIIEKDKKKGLPVLLLSQNKPVLVEKATINFNIAEEQDWEQYVIFLLFIVFFIFKKAK